MPSCCSELKIAYELNPPKIAPEGRLYDRQGLDADMQAMVDRASRLGKLAAVGGIHLTDSVLGVPRVSSLTAAHHVKKVIDGSSVKTRCSLRTSDRNVITLYQAATDAILLGVDSLLVLMGDAPTDGRDSGLKPSAAIALLKEKGFDRNIKLHMSFPARVPADKKDSPAVRSKLAALPHAFVTQSISSLSDLGGIVDLAKPHGIGVVACIMVPSEKNLQSARMIGLDWSLYEKEPAEFVRAAGRLAGSVLLTSPNSFASGLDLLKQLA